MLCLTSCCKWCPVVEHTVEVKIPVAVACPVPPQFEQIADPVLTFTPSTDVLQMVKDLRASRVLWRDRAIKQDIILNSYRNYSGSKK